MNRRRRNFLKNTGVLAGSFVLPFQWEIAKKASKIKKNLELGRPDIDEDYWKMVKSLFNIPGDKIMANSANLCPSPHFVNEGIADYTSALSKDVSFQYRSVFAERRKLALQKLSIYLKCAQSQIGITRNTSEANNIIVNGLDLTKNDEVLLWDQNHPSNLATWLQRSKRIGFKTKVIMTPNQPGSTDELFHTFTSAVTPNTRVIAFSHISNVSGIALPVSDLCQWAQERKIFTLVDGAQSFGFKALNLQDMGCSFYTASAHKWLMGPLENGIIYIRKEDQEKVWPNIIAAGWKQEMTSVDDQFCHLGQRHTPGTSLLPEIVDFHQNIGLNKLENRIILLNTYLKNQLDNQLPGVKFITPREEDLSGGVTIFSIEGKDPMEIFNRLYSEYKIAAAPVNGVRISPTITTTLSDIDKIVEAVGIIVGA